MLYIFFFLNDQTKTQFVSLSNFELNDVAILGLIQSSEVVEQLKKHEQSCSRIWYFIF